MSVYATFTVTPLDSEGQQKLQSYTLNYLRDVTPVRTGLLRSSWNVEVNGSQVSISNPVHYARYVNYGTRRMRARNMTGDAIPAAEEFANELSDIKQFVDNAPKEFKGTGVKSVDEAILEVSRKLIGGPDKTDKQVGLFSPGVRTLKTYNPTASNSAFRLIGALEAASKKANISPLRYTTLREAYGAVGESFGVGPLLQTISDI